MQIQDKNSIRSQQKPAPAEPRKRGKWLAGLGAFLVVLLVVGGSMLVFAAARQRQGSQPLPAGQWKQVQTGYLFLSVQAAPSNPAVLYACATTSAAISNQGFENVTILRSADFGDHWQARGSNPGLGVYCELTVNPSNENDIYVVSANIAPQSNAVLKHSADGGQTWTTITPAFSPPLPEQGSKTALPWFVQLLRYDGHNLYGVQWVSTRLPVIQGPPFFNRSLRLVTSADGGHTWHIIDGQFTTKGLGVQSYALDTTHRGTIYEIAGQPPFPVETAPRPTNDVQPIVGIEQQLFKSTDNGTHWQSLLTSLPYGSQVQLASANPQIVYVGGIRGPLPLMSHYVPGQATTNRPVPSTSIFHLQVSTNGGASWQQVAAPPDEQGIQGWFVSADGNVYTSPTVSFNSPGVGVTAIVGTAIVGTPVPPAPVTPVIGTPLPATPSNGGLPDIQPPLPVSHPFILSYILASHSWSQVTTPPTGGRLLQVTPADTHGGAILWYVGLQGAHYTLYRFGV